MGEHVRRFAALLTACLLLVSSAAAELLWPDSQTAAQQKLKEYIDRVNHHLAQCGETPVNTVFEMYPTFASMGATEDPSLLVPEGVELYFALYDASLHKLELMVSNPEQFGQLAAACLQAASPDSMTLESALLYVQPYVSRVNEAPQNSFEEMVNEMNGTSPRAYFAYYPNMFRDGTDWLQMTIIFPLAGANDSFAGSTPPPESDVTYEGYLDYYPEDDYSHLEVFATATPEPDSPAADEYN